MSEIVIRRAELRDVAGISTVHVTAHQQTYRGLISDDVLDSPTALARREDQWTETLSTPAGGVLVVVAARDDVIVGIASGGTPRDDDADWPVELHTLYLLWSEHGRGTAARLLTAVIGEQPASLWVADPNPRAQAFYRKHGFAPDGLRKQSIVSEIRMRRVQRSGGRAAAEFVDATIAARL